MTRTMLASCMLLFLPIGAVPGEEKPFPAETELQAQARRRELLHQQLKELLASPDLDVRRVGLVFHVLGKYDPQDRLPLLQDDRYLVRAILQSLEGAPVPEEMVQALIARLAADPEWGFEDGVKLLEDFVPSWRNRQEVEGVILQLLDRLQKDELPIQSREILKQLGSRMVPSIPSLLTRAEQAGDAELVGNLFQVIPWNSLGEQRDDVIRRVSALLLRHQSRELDGLIWSAWGDNSLSLQPEEFDPLVRDALQFRMSDPEGHRLWTAVRVQATALDKLSPGWRERPVARESIQQLRIEAAREDAPERSWAVTILVGMLETRHPEVRQYLLEQAASSEEEDLARIEWLLRTTPEELDLSPGEREQLLRYWTKLLEEPPSLLRWWWGLVCLAWLGEDARPAVPQLLWQLERLLWEDDEFMRAHLAGEFDDFLGASPLKFVQTLDKIEPEWRESLAGRRIATLCGDRIEWLMRQELPVQNWERLLWQEAGWRAPTPGLRSVMIEYCLNPEKQAPPGTDMDRDCLVAYLDYCSPGWPDLPEARKHWPQLEAGFPWPDDPGRNVLFLQLTLHHPGLSREQRRHYLLEALAAGLCLGQDFLTALDRLEPAWSQSPQARQAIPILVKQFQAELVQDDRSVDPDRWQMLKRLGAADQFEFPLLLRVWLTKYEGFADPVDDLGLPPDRQAQEQRLRELNPDYLLTSELGLHRQRRLTRLTDPDEWTRYDAFVHCFSPGLLKHPSQADFQLLPELLTRLARRKEVEPHAGGGDNEGNPTPGNRSLTARQLHQVVLNLRRQKILDGPILLPAAKASGMNP